MAASRKSSLCLARGLTRVLVKNPTNHHYNYNNYDTHRLRLLSSYSTKIFPCQQNPQAHFLTSCLNSTKTHSLANTNNKTFSPSLFFNFSAQINDSEFTEMAWEGIVGAVDAARISKQQVVQSEHLMKALLEQKDGLARRILTKAGLDNTSVLQATDDYIYKQPKVIGETSGPVMGPDLNVLLSNARNHKREMKDDFVSVEHLLLAFLSDKRFGQQLFRNLQLSEQTLKDAVKAVRGNQRVTDQNPEGKYDVLDKYGNDLTELARRGKLDPVIGRDDEIRRCIQILSRRTKNNPVIIGEPGVGKTAIAEGLAQRIFRGDVPEPLMNRKLAAARGLSRVLDHHSTWVFSRQQNPHKSFNFTSPYSTNAPHQNVDKTSKDVSWNLWVPNQYSGGIYEALENYGIDLTELASRGIIDPVIGRDEEIERCIHILSQKTKNNPVIVGVAGVAKTAIAEGLAQRIYHGDVPECLRNRQLFSVDIGSLLVGAMYTGQFEERIKQVIREVTASNGQIILFIDEIQTVVGAVKEVICTRRQRSCIICLDLANFNHIMKPKSYDICSTLLCLRSNFLWQILAILGSKQ